MSEPGEPIRGFESRLFGFADPCRKFRTSVALPVGGGWWFVGCVQGEVAPGSDANTHREPEPIVTSLASVPCLCAPCLMTTPCVAYAEIHSNEKTITAIGTFPAGQCRGWLPGAGVRLERVFSDNESAYNTHDWCVACAKVGYHSEENPPPPAPDQREDRTLPPHPHRRLGRFHATTTRNQLTTQHSPPRVC
jgi:hypothetical protein